MLFNERSIKFESWLFILFAGLNLIPVIFCKFFPTLDGAAHLHNSVLIPHLFLGNEQLMEFFVFNKEPIPNWTGHLILIIFNWFFPAVFAEKVLLILLLLGLPFAFRSLLLTVAPQNKYFSYLVFPFSYSFVFYLGFYNFSLAVILLLITMGYWFKNNDKPNTLKRLLVLFVCFTLMYFSHIFIFGIVGLLIGMHLLFQAAISLFQSRKQYAAILAKLAGKMSLLLGASFLPLVLFVSYFRSRPTSINIKYVSTEELIEWLKIFRPAITFDLKAEAVYTEKIVWLLAALFLTSLYTKFRNLLFGGRISLQAGEQLKAKAGKLVSIFNFWFFATAFMLLLYFKFPDSVAKASFISVRLGLLFFLFATIWLATLEYPKWIRYAILITVVIVNIGLYKYHRISTKFLRVVANECYNASQFIPANSTVLPLNYTGNWFMAHFSNYLGTEKPMIVLENYECGLDYFPIVWNYEKIPNTMIGNTNMAQIPCAWWITDTSHVKKQIDYIFVLGDQDATPDTCHRDLKKNILEYYELVYTSENSTLYHKRR